MPNALGLVPAATIDQATGPVVRGINARFGTHYDPRFATDQILNAAGVLSGTGETSAAESSLARAGETSDVQHLLTGSETSTAHRVFPTGAGTSRVAAQVGEHPQFTRLRPNLSVAYTAPESHGNVLGRNSAGDNVVPLSDEFMLRHERRMKSLQDLPEEIQDKYHSAISDSIIDPILDDPDYHGHNSAAVENIRRELASMADDQRAPDGHPRLADALDAANEDFRVMVNEKQPEMAKELGLSLPEGSTANASSTSDSDASQIAPRGKILNFAQHVPPPPPPKGPYDGLDLDDFGEEIGDYLEKMQEKFGPEPVVGLMNMWRDINAPANDNFPLPDWAGRTKPQKPLEFPFIDLDSARRLNELIPEHELQAWMRSAANDGGPQSSDQNWQQYLKGLQYAPPDQLPSVENAARAPLRVAWTAPQPGPTNAFSGATSAPETVNWTAVPSAPRQANGFDFNALRPPRWLGPTMVGLANQPQYSQQPQN